MLRYLTTFGMLIAAISHFVPTALSQTTKSQPTKQIDFSSEVLPVELTVGYAVRAVDVNADNRLDIAIVDSKRVLWLENPSWQAHIIYETPAAKFDNVCFAPHDINSDGRLDFALGADWQVNNSNSGGTIGWLEQPQSGPWRMHAIATEPTTHRMNWVKLGSTDQPSLVVAPLKGRGVLPPEFDQIGVRLLAFDPPQNPTEQTWERRLITDALHVMHNFEVVDLNEDGQSELLTASYEGVTWVQFDGDKNVTQRRLGAGQEQPAPKRGASEIRRGRLVGGRNYLATVEPWHGDKIVVYISPENWLSSNELWSRTVLDNQLAWGHAVACANLDEDPDEELIIGIRDNLSEQHRSGLRIYDPDFPLEGKWNRQIVDAGGVAIEDLTVADLDGDGDIDIVAVGRATHNAKIYWNQLH